jgi:hypothetical protein
LTGVRLGSERMQTFTHQVAEGLTVLDGAPTRDEIARRIAEVAAGRLRRPVLVRGIDGAYGPTRPASARGRRSGPGRHRARRALGRGQWRDAKGLRVYLLAGERRVHLLRWHQVQTEAQRGEALKQVQESGMRPEAQVRRCGVADGAPWLGKHVKALWAHACQVLDSSHGAADLQGGATAQYGLSFQALEWVEATMTRWY